jgi:hypothetical protein
MKRGRSTGNKTKAQQARLCAFKDIGRSACRHTFLMFGDVCAELWEVASVNRWWIWPCQRFQ